MILVMRVAWLVTLLGLIYVAPARAQAAPQ